MLMEKSFPFVAFIKLSVDNVPMATINPPTGGFWENGNFSNSFENPWQYGSRMAPFDQEVFQKFIHFFNLISTDHLSPISILAHYLFHIQFYLIINLAVGGVNEYFPSNAKNEGGANRPWSSTSTNVRV